MGIDGVDASFFLASIFVLLASGFLALLIGKYPSAANWISHGGALIGSGLMTVSALQVMRDGHELTGLSWQPIPQLELAFQIDSLSAFFLLLISVVAIAVSIYSIGYVKEYIGRKPIGLLGGGLNLFLLSMWLVVTAANGFSFLLAWEWMSLVSFLLVMFEHEKPPVRHAGFVYVVMTHFGTVFIILSFLTLYMYTGSLDFAVFTAMSKQSPDSVKNLVFILALVGFGTKAGILPLHVWLPRAHPAAPSHISALMSAVMIKTAVYGLIRVIYDFLAGGAVWWGVLVLGLGLLSAFFGILYGIAQTDLKRFLAYSSTENMGIIWIGLGASMLFYAFQHPLLGALALMASLLHAFNHALFKGLLFMGAGAVVYATHSKNMEQMGGLIRRMPWTAFLFLTGVLALAAFPPLNGFVSEWAIFQSLLQVAFDLNSPVWKIGGGLAAAGLALTGGLVAAAAVKVMGTVFLAMPRSEQAQHAAEVPLSMRFGMGVLALGTFALGIWPEWVLSLMQHVSARYFAAAAVPELFLQIPFAETANRTLSMGTLFVAGLVLLIVTLAGLRVWVGKNQIRQDSTWGCGNVLQPAMEYTGTSFSHPILMIFKNIYRPQRDVEIRETYAYYPRRIRHRLQISSVLEHKLYRPAVRLAVAASRRIRTIQNGNLQSYLAYMVVTLIGLLLWIR